MIHLMENVRDSTFNDQNAGRVDFFPPLTDHIDVVGVTTTSYTYAIPTGAKFLIFYPAAGLEYAVRRNEDAVYPSVTVTDGTGSILSPGQFDVEGLTSIGIISNSAGPLTIAVYG